MRRSTRRQRGIGLVALMLGGGLFFFVALLGMKVAPDVLAYYTVLKNVNATAHDPGLGASSVSQIRGAYLKRTQVEGGSPVAPEDLDVSKEGSEIVISFAYSKKIPLFANVSLVIDFAGSSK